MSKDEFIANVIYYLFKDKTYGDTTLLKQTFAKLFRCDYCDDRVNNCYVKVTNYQIKKYGHSLYYPELRRHRR